MHQPAFKPRLLASARPDAPEAFDALAAPVKDEQPIALRPPLHKQLLQLRRWAVYDWGADQPMAFLRYSVVWEHQGSIVPRTGEPPPRAKGCTRVKGELSMVEADCLVDRLEAERPPAPDGTPVGRAPMNLDGTYRPFRHNLPPGTFVD